MSDFIPIYELDLRNNLCYFDGIQLTEYDNTIHDTGYTYSGITLILDYNNFTSYFDTTGHTYSNIILNNDIYTYTGLTNEIHYLQIETFHLGATPYIDPILSGLTEEQVITGFTTDIISCSDRLDGFSGTCCPTQQILSNLPYVIITNEGGGIDNCENYIQRRTPKGWTLDFVFNKNGETNWTESVFWFTGVRDEYEVENFADNGISFRFTDEGKISWTSYRYSGYCDISGFTELYYIDSGITKNALCPDGTSDDFNITITFERNNVYEDDCDLANEGGWNDLIVSISGDTTERLNIKWTNERNKRLGTLKLYHNGRPLEIEVPISPISNFRNLPVYKVKNFEEIVLSDRGFQPFTHVVGGGVTGSGGIHNSVCCYSIKYAAYFEDYLKPLDVRQRYLTTTKTAFDINECWDPCEDNIYKHVTTITSDIMFYMVDSTLITSDKN